MNLTRNAATMMAQEPKLTGADLRVWLLLVDTKASAAELAADLGAVQTNVAASCRRLYHAGWVDIVEVIGRTKRYKARATRNPNAALQGQLELQGN